MLEKLKVKYFKNNLLKQENQQECCICMTEYKINDKLLILPCNS